MYRIEVAAGDSTGFESGHCSKYFTKRRKQGKNKGDPDLPVAGRPTDRLPTGKWRWLMATEFDPEEVYGQRWQAETVMRMIKSRQGESLTARSDTARDAELGLMVLTHNLMVVLRAQCRGFLQSMSDTVCRDAHRRGQPPGYLHPRARAGDDP